jgi:hypothetical protein
MLWRAIADADEASLSERLVARDASDFARSVGLRKLPAAQQGKRTAKRRDAGAAHKYPRTTRYLN